MDGAAEILGAPIGRVLLNPGDIFEVSLAVWLLIKGFMPTAYDSVFHDRRPGRSTGTAR